MRILGIDPGKRAGWALFWRELYQRSGVVSGDDLAQVQLVLEAAAPDVVVIEDQFHGRLRGGKMPSWLSIKTLLRRRHAWELLAGARGIEIATVNPASWQNFFQLRAGDKDGICRLASVIVGQAVEPDEGDAVLVANWWAVNESTRELMGRAAT